MPGNCNVINVIPSYFNEDWPLVVRCLGGCRLTDCQVESLHTHTHTHTSTDSHNDCSQLRGKLKPIDREAVRPLPAQTFLIALWHLHSGGFCVLRSNLRIKKRAHFLLFFFLFYMLLGTSMSRHKHVVGVVQQIAICTWTGPGENWGKKEREGWREGGCRWREAGWGDGERKREYLRALECQYGCSHFSQWTEPGPLAPWHDFSL